MYVDVYKNACTSCVKLFLTNGIGSAPYIWTISEFKSFGSNIGRKVKEYKPCIPMHPFCRCTPHAFREGSIWDKVTKRFELPKLIAPTNRKPIRFSVEINGVTKEYSV